MPDAAAAHTTGVFSDVLANADVITQTNLALLVGIGPAREETAPPVLVPMVELTVHEHADDPAESGAAYVGIISVPNAAFVLRELSADLVRVTDQLCEIAAGRLKPDPDSVHDTMSYLADAEASLAACRRRLAGLGAPDAA
ncbi:MAG: hypothetical protein ACFE0R_04295 [Salinarimonas sp.]